MNVGGPALQAVTLLNHLDPARFEQRIYTGALAPGEGDYLDLRGQGAAAIRVPGLGRSIGPRDDVRALARLVREMRAFRPHIVHTHTAKAGALGRVAATIARVPARVHTFHGHLLHGYFTGPKRAAMIATERGLARLSHRLVAVGEQVRDDLLAAGIGRPEKFTVLPPGTRVPPLPPRRQARVELGLPQDVPVVAFIGRITQVKRPDRFLEAARLIRGTVPDAHFAVCGDGDLADTLRGVPGLRLLGWRPDLETVHAAADLVLLTSDNEGTPLSLIEAALSGVPCVATRVGSVPEVVADGATGLLTGCDSRELAAAAILLLTDRDLADRLGRAAAARAERLFGIPRFVDDVRALYEDLYQHNPVLADISGAR
ncbi:D-inositol 3-phosphate glycosyltransferase [Acrocarpospora pleiomorpha]|uniref:D-inositol 3-phosphate glycosyltransferase n=2 Tax=Acrocarpospora pleiomorpha TaxID=90975 RepID=A0A5M3XU50_9ACTN|nr:D-inositol 3-phosphate glycosyltransferase [Acrocarpospora pleiomorpha]